MSFTGMNLSQALPRMMKKPCPKCGSHCLSFTCNRSNPEGMFNEFTITDEKGRKRTGNLAVLCCGCYSVMPIGEYLLDTQSFFCYNERVDRQSQPYFENGFKIL